MNKDQLNTIDAYDKSADQFVASIAKLPNYNHTYDFLIERLNSGDTILDLACGPAQISKYITNKINVSHVTSNRGKRTPGVDNVTWKTAEQK